MLFVCNKLWTYYDVVSCKQHTIVSDTQFISILRTYIFGQGKVMFWTHISGRREYTSPFTMKCRVCQCGNCPLVPVLPLGCQLHSEACQIEYGVTSQSSLAQRGMARLSMPMLPLGQRLHSKAWPDWVCRCCPSVISCIARHGPDWVCKCCPSVISCIARHCQIEGASVASVISCIARHGQIECASVAPQLSVAQRGMARLSMSSQTCLIWTSGRLVEGRVFGAFRLLLGLCASFRSSWHLEYVCPGNALPTWSLGFCYICMVG